MRRAGRLAAPRFVQYGRDYAGAQDGDWAYVYFPGTTDGAKGASLLSPAASVLTSVMSEQGRTRPMMRQSTTISGGDVVVGVVQRTGELPAPA